VLSGQSTGDAARFRAFQNPPVRLAVIGTGSVFESVLKQLWRDRTPSAVLEFAALLLVSGSLKVVRDPSAVI
jgi:hypothetical protein